MRASPIDRPETGPAAWQLPWPIAAPWLLWRLIGVRWALWLSGAAWFVWPRVVHPYQMSLAHDASYFLHHATAAWQSLRNYGELPVWNPWYCGGIAQLGNVQDSAWSPSVLVLAALGVEPGLVLVVVLFFAAGMEGAWRLARTVGATRVSACAAAFGFVLSGRFAMIFVDGQSAFVGFALAPWVLLGWLRGMDNRWAAVGGGVAMALVFCEGGAVATPLLGVLLAWAVPVLAVGRLLPRPGHPWRPRRALDPLISLAIVGLVAVGLAAPRLAVVAESLARFPRQWLSPSHYDLGQVAKMLFEPSAAGGYDGPGTAYVGLLLAGAAVWGVVRRPIKTLPMVAVLALSIGLALGQQGPWAPWSLTTHLPVLHNLRCPFRMAFFAALGIAVLAAVGIGAAERDLRAAGLWCLGRWRAARPLRVEALARTMATAFALVAVGLVVRDPALFSRARALEAGLKPTSRSADEPFRQAVGNRWMSHLWTRLGVGTLGCFEEQPFATTAALRGDLAQEEYLTDPSAGRVRRLRWTPHSVTVRAELERPATVRINQNWHRAWTTDVGRIVRDDGLVAVALPAGVHEVRVRFSDPWVWAGVWLSATVAMALAVFGARAALRGTADQRADG
ncbi:MAG: hypothetical protein FJ100_20980 [Deltaproteobacteria bacterium]|nr:hypothetical protein [Deltaproteobacteria bacterium]